MLTSMRTLTDEQFDNVLQIIEERQKNLLRIGSTFKMKNYDDRLYYLNTYGHCGTPVCRIVECVNNRVRVVATWTGGGCNAIIPNNIVLRQVNLPVCLIVMYNLINFFAKIFSPQKEDQTKRNTKNFSIKLINPKEGK